MSELGVGPTVSCPHSAFPVTGQGSSARRASVHLCGRSGVCHSTGGQVGRDGGACPPRNFSVWLPDMERAVEQPLASLINLIHLDTVFK